MGEGWIDWVALFVVAGDLVAVHPRSGNWVVSLRRSRSEGVFALVDGFAEGGSCFCLLGTGR